MKHHNNPPKAVNGRTAFTNIAGQVAQHFGRVHYHAAHGRKGKPDQDAQNVEEQMTSQRGPFFVVLHPVGQFFAKTILS